MLACTPTTEHISGVRKRTLFSYSLLVCASRSLARQQLNSCPVFQLQSSGWRFVLTCTATTEQLSSVRKNTLFSYKYSTRASVQPTYHFPRPCWFGSVPGTDQQPNSWCGESQFLIPEGLRTSDPPSQQRGLVPLHPTHPSLRSVRSASPDVGRTQSARRCRAVGQADSGRRSPLALHEVYKPVVLYPDVPTGTTHGLQMGSGRGTAPRISVPPPVGHNAPEVPQSLRRDTRR